MTLLKYTNEIGYNSLNANGQDQDAEYVKAVLPPFGCIQSWHKTFNNLSTGTADTNTVDKLVDSTADFSTNGIVSGMIVKNTTDDTFAIVDSVDSPTSLTLKADVQAGSSTTDIFPLGTEGYIIYGNYELPGAWYEANGQTISDTDSPFNGATLPDLNSDIIAGQGGRFLRGANTSGVEQGDQNKAHTHTYDRSSGDGGGAVGGSAPFDQNTSTASGSNGGTESRPYNFSVVFIIRIK